MITLDQLNDAPPAQAALMLDGLYEHSPWIAQAALAQRPFRSPAHLKHAMARIVAEAGAINVRKISGLDGREKLQMRRRRVRKPWPPKRVRRPITPVIGWASPPSPCS